MERKVGLRRVRLADEIKVTRDDRSAGRNSEKFDPAGYKSSWFEATFLTQEYVKGLMKTCKEHRTENDAACEDSVAHHHDPYMIGYIIL